MSNAAPRSMTAARACDKRSPMSASGFGLIRGAIIAAVAGSLSGAALAQDSVNPNTQTPSDAAKPQADPESAMLGAWEFSNADHDKICRFVFRADAVAGATGGAGGHKLDIDKTCANVFPSTKDIVGWAVDNFGALRLLDAQGKAVIELEEAETGLYDGFEPGQGRYVLQSAAAAPVRSAADMIGGWAIARGTGKPICALTLANTPAAVGGAAAGALALKLKPGCNAFITRFNPTSWRMDQGDLILLSARGQTWRFEENDANSWQRVPESPDPVLLVRQ